MGPVAVFYMAFASISIFACILQLAISFRKRGDIPFLIGSIFSLFIFINFSILVVCSTSFGINCPPFILFRIQLILNQAVSICMLGVIYYLMKEDRKIFLFIIIVIFGLFILVCLFIPDTILFGENAASRRMSLLNGDSILMITTGLTIWRVLNDLTILLLVFSASLIIIKRMGNISTWTIVILFSGLGIIMLAALFDHLVDHGDISSIYMFPFALFTLYIILILLPYDDILKEISDRQNIIQQEIKWCQLIKEAEVIVVHLDRMGHVLYINPYFYKLTGFHEDEVLGKDWFEFFIPSKDHYKVQGAFVEILNSEFHPHYLNPILTVNKEEKMISWFNVRSRNHLGNITGSLSIGVDVTYETTEKENLFKKLAEAESLISSFRNKAGQS
jgi:PAS domain S-box-containing protein